MGHFQMLATKKNDPRELNDLFEGAVYEYSLREKERTKLLDIIVEK